jgi:hypothetical protein
MVDQGPERPFEHEYGPDEVPVFRLPCPILNLIPTEALLHLIAAQTELLLAMRSLLYAFIGRRPNREPEEGRPRTKITVE